MRGPVRLRIRAVTRALGIPMLLAVVVLLPAGEPLAAAGAAPTTPAYRSAPSMGLPGGITQAEYASRQQALHAWLLAQMPEGTLSRPLAADLTEEERTDLLARQGSRGGPGVVGRTKPIMEVIRFSDLNSRLVVSTRQGVGHGILETTPDGGFVWAVSLRSKESAAVRVHIRGLSLPDDADLFWFNPTGQAFGPYQRRGPHGDGDFWTHTVSGSEAVLLLRHFGPNGATDLRRISFIISDLGHITPELRPATAIATESFCSYNEWCIENINCSSPDNAVSVARDAVAMMQWISGAFIYTCTGGLLNDAAGTGARNFLTANHCLSKGKDAKNLETYFGFDVPCNATCPQQTNPGFAPVLGASVQSSNRDGDYTLLLLSDTDPLPAGTRFMAWNSAPVAFSDGAPLYRVSHPNWAPQAYSEHSVDAETGTCTGWPRGGWIYSRDTFGATEGGSSGAPVVNGAGEVVGQLSGACGYNPGDPCDNESNDTVDGAFAHYFPNIQSILDNGGGPGPETDCSDGVDNDGDGATDCADSDCDSDPACTGSCEPAGASCTEDADCCSNKCKGAPGKKICR